jgi:hypothetical protein
MAGRTTAPESKTAVRSSPARATNGDHRIALFWRAARARCAAIGSAMRRRGVIIGRAVEGEFLILELRILTPADSSASLRASGILNSRNKNGQTK